MKHITEDDLILLYYGEHEDLNLAATVAESDELTARFEQLSAELKMADSFVAPPRGEDYPSAVWQRIAPQLDNELEEKTSWLNTWWSGLGRPNLSLAGAVSLALVATLAFMLGRNGALETPAGPLVSQDNPINQSAQVLANVDSVQLLTHSVSNHLEQVNLMLTQFANSSVSLADESSNATDVLVANRLYRQAAINQGNQQLAGLLTELEPLLIEMAFDAQQNSPATRERMQKEVNDGLLFKVRVMNNQLKKPQTSV